MDSQNQIQDLKISKEKIAYEEPMRKHTTFQIGGPAQYFIKIDNVTDLKRTLEFAHQKNIPITVLGNGSNVLVLDKGIEGITLNIRLEKIEIREEKDQIQITVGAGEKLGKLARNLLPKRNRRIRRIIWNTRYHRWSCQNECRSPWKRNERHCKNRKMF